jgi:2-amino-4-hydroxy-6-hydroxymethyldihydropteridine diphosphokinase
MSDSGDPRAADAPAPRLAYLALGSNLGDPVGHLRAALDELDRAVGRLIAVSGAYETEPVGLTDQPRFLNAVCALETALEPRELLVAMLKIETDQGRVRTVKNGPRTLDLDLLIYESRVIDEPGLAVPHPRMGERAFVLVPLAEIAPNLLHPVTGQSVREMLGRLSPGSRGHGGVGPPISLRR